MKFKESHTIEGLIKERRKSLAREDLSEFELDKRARALNVLIEARDKLDHIGRMQEPKPFEPSIIKRQRQRYSEMRGTVSGID